MKKPTKKHAKEALNEAIFELSIRSVSMRDELHNCGNKKRIAYLERQIERLEKACEVLWWIESNYKLP